MQKEKLFIFWLGDKTKIDKTRYDNDNFKVIIGPSDSEHKFLMENYPYYRVGFENRKFSFCSDVWRLFVLSKERGLYIDASVLTGKKIQNFIEEIRDFDVAAFRGNYKYIESGVLWSGKKNNDFFAQVLKEYYTKEMSIASIVMPAILSSYIFNLGFDFGWEKQIKDRILILPLTKIRDKETVWKTGVGSWSTRDKNKDYFKAAQEIDGWKSWEDQFLSRKKSKRWNGLVEKWMAGERIDIHLLREFYESGLEKVSRVQLEQDYKKMKIKPKLFEKLIWSKIFLFFKRQQ